MAKQTDDALLNEVVRRLVAALEPERIYLFGSHARGDADHDSDYDFYIVVPGPVRDRRALELTAYRSLMGLGVAKDTLVMDADAFDRQSAVVASLPATVLREGRLLYAA